jgi:hypothetical protein
VFNGRLERLEPTIDEHAGTTAADAT